jgi:hypothetical protein
LNEDGGSRITASSFFSEEQLTNCGEYSPFLAGFLGYVTGTVKNCLLQALRSRQTAKTITGDGLVPEAHREQI